MHGKGLFEKREREITVTEIAKENGVPVRMICRLTQLYAKQGE